MPHKLTDAQKEEDRRTRIQHHDGMAVDNWSVPMLDFDYSNEQPDIEAVYSEYESN